ncbi:hypothetical protein JCM5353_005141 [Sporobolomyces roseus]
MADLRVRISTSGFTSLVGDLIDSIALNFVKEASSSGHSFHITLLTKVEAHTLKERNVGTPFAGLRIESDDILVLGLGTDRGAKFVVVLINKINILRLKLGLPSKNFHISLSTPIGLSGPEDVYHGVETVPVDLLSSPHTSLATFDALALHHLLRQDFSPSLATSLFASSRFPSFPQPFLRIADAAYRLGQYKLAMVAYAQTFDLAEPSQTSLRNYALKQIGRCSRFAEWGPTYLDCERNQFDDVNEDCRKRLLGSWSEELRTRCAEMVESLDAPDLSIESRERANVRTNDGEYKLQRFFRWIVPFRLAVSSTPRSEDDIQALSSPYIGIRHVVTLTKETPVPPSWFPPTSTQASSPSSTIHTFLPITDQRSPSVEQIQLFLRLASNPAEGPLLVHCGGGKGRAGVMIASWIVAYGFSVPPRAWRYPAFSPAQAIDLLRQIRPGSIETMDQEHGLKRFYKQMSKDGAPYPPLLEEPFEAEPTIEGSVANADLLILVGLPGSGKTSFRQALVARDPSWRSVSGDEDGGKSAVLAAASALRPGNKLIIDRCNISIASRQELLSLAQHSLHPIAIYFSANSELCQQRAQLRSNHPSLSPAAVKAAIKQFSSQLVPPSLKEGFTAVVTVPSIPAASSLLRLLSPPIKLLKFPRTPHLLDLGAATSDDLVAPQSLSSSIQPGQVVIITEKVDGANMGISLDENRRIIVQNRSHYVDSTTHRQFKKLGWWIEAHEHELQAILGSDETFVERFILYVTCSAPAFLTIAFQIYSSHSISSTVRPQPFYLDLPYSAISRGLQSRWYQRYIVASRYRAPIDSSN